MQTELIPTLAQTGPIVLIGLVALYFWRENRTLVRQAVGLSMLACASESGRRYKEIFDNGSDGVFVVEALPRGNFRFESLNPAALQAISPKGIDLAGCRFDELPGRRKSPEFGVFLKELEHRLNRCIANGLPLEYECELRGAANSGCSLLLKLVPMLDDGGISHILCFAQDITARKLYERALLERVKLEERLSGFVASAPGFFYTYRHGADGSNAMPFASAGINALFGLRPEHVSRSIAPMNLLIHPDDMQAVIEATARSAAALSPLESEFRVQHPQRGELWVESRALPKSEPDGSIVWHGFMHDVTERKQIEARYLAGSSLLKSVLESSPDVIVFALDPDYRYLAFNNRHRETMRAIWGKEIEIGMDMLNDVIGEHPDREAARAGLDRALSGECFVTEQAYGKETLLREHWQTFSSPIRSDAGEVVGLTCFVLNISERKRMEDELHRKREILAEAQRIGQMGSWELNLESGLLTWSDEIFRIFEIDPNLFEASYEAFLDAIHPDDRDAVNKAYTDSVKNGSPYCIDHRLQFPDGRIKYVRECCETHYDDDGQAVRSHGTVQDITVLKETELHLKATQDKLRELVISREALIEEERKHIAWELHEELGQLLAATRLRMHSMRGQLPKNIPSVDEGSRAIDQLIERSIRTVHGLVSGLRPTVLMHGPVAALEWLVAEFTARHAIGCRLMVDEDGIIAGDNLTILVFRIAQELIENAARHSGVESVRVSWICTRSGYRLAVEHDGAPLENDSAGGISLSLFWIQERVSAFGGEMRISGTAIEANFPVSESRENQYQLFGKYDNRDSRTLEGESLS